MKLVFKLVKLLLVIGVIFLVFAHKFINLCVRKRILEDNFFPRNIIIMFALLFFSILINFIEMKINEKEKKFLPQ